MSNDPHETPTPLEVRHEDPIVAPHPPESHPDTPSAPLPGHAPAARTGESDSDAALEPELSAGADATSEPELPAGDDARPEPELPAGDDATAGGEEDPSEVEPVTRTARQLSHEVAGIAGVESLAPGMKDLVASATARVLRRAGGQPTGIDLSESDDGWRVRIDAHFDDSRSVASIVDEIFTVVDREVGAPVEVDLRVISGDGSH